MTRFIFFGRLTHEKGIDLVLETFSLLASDVGSNLPRSLDIYGAGPYAHTCAEVAARHPTRIHFHGRTPQATIWKELPHFDYCLMPSRVIETFGKSAAESLAAGVQVIGYRHGGLEQFINPSLAIGPEQQDFSTLITKVLQGTLVRPPLPDLSAYSTDVWLDHIADMLPSTAETKRILLVSDFITQTGGGIESFLHEVRALLTQHGYEVALCGSSRPVGFRGLFATAWNIRERRRVRSAIHGWHPDVVRYHSTLRWMGRLPMCLNPTTPSTPHAQKRRMMHDMGYVYPHPAQLTSEQQIPSHHSLHARLATVRHRNFIVKVLTVAKRTLQKCISYTLHSFDRILIPSEFMRPCAKQLAPDRLIACLPHFVIK